MSDNLDNLDNLVKQSRDLHYQVKDLQLKETEVNLKIKAIKEKNPQIEVMDLVCVLQDQLAESEKKRLCAEGKLEYAYKHLIRADRLLY